MDIEEIKKNWDEISALKTDSIIKPEEIQMYVRKYNLKNKLKVLLPEILMLLLYAYLIFMFIVFHDQFESAILKVSALGTILILLGLSGLVIHTTRKFRASTVLSDSYFNTLDQIMDQCKQLNKRYYLIIGMNLASLLLSIILLPRIYAEDPTSEQTLITFGVGAGILLWCSYKIYKYYQKLILKNNYLQKRLFRDLELI